MCKALGCTLILLFTSGALFAGLPTVNNDDSCDVIVAPAATLLLPYFDVELERANESTRFTVINVTQLPRVARVTIWTDWSFPVLSYSIFLTGYDTQTIDLFDVLSTGRLAGLEGTSSDAWPPGDRSLDNDDNPLLDIADCDAIPLQLSAAVLLPIVRALTTGRGAGRCPNDRVGGEHRNAVGYVTIDVVESCNMSLPTDPGYFDSEILYDNVLTGDYEQVNQVTNLAQGGPLVHIRAIPEGGGTGVHPTNFATTFYSNYQNGGTADRRQPLPATFAARWISSSDGPLKTNFKIWREGITRAHSGCGVLSNSALTVADLVRFDEDENPVAFSDCETCDALFRPLLPASSSRSSDDAVFPPNPDGATAGWMYMNLNNQGVFPFRPYAVASQNWVVVSMEGGGRYSADFDAASLGNGCTPSVPPTGSGEGETVIAPATNTIKPAFASGAPATINNDDSCDIKVAPAATLLLPYFEVDLVNPHDQTTFFTITNVTPLPQIARVTLWTDRAFPVLAFNIFLTGYDVQSIDLSDVLIHGRIAEPGTSSNSEVGRRSAGNDANPLIDTTACGNLPDRLPPQILADLRSVLTFGRTTGCGNRVGELHANGHAVGYATIDVVRNCGATMPVDAGYFSTEILYDNVLIGDYQQVDSSQSSAQGNTLVHIRAIPEGGLSGSAQTTFRRTFYSRLQNGGTADRRQPLPSAFAARWNNGPIGEPRSSYKIWREAVTGAAAGCAVTANAVLMYPDVVRFDEEENPTALHYLCVSLCPSPGDDYVSPAAWGVNVDNSGVYLPPNPDNALSGWMYINLDNYPFMGAPSDDIAAQSWVIVSTAVEGRYAVEYDATSLGNGCSPPALMTDEEGNAPAIGPAPNVNPRATPTP